MRFSGPGPYAPPDIDDYGQCSVGIKVMGVPGPKLMEDEQGTQDLILVTPASFVTPNIRENAKLQRWVRAKAGIVHFLNPFDSHVLDMVEQALWSPMHTSPLEVQYYSNVPFLLGEGQAVRYSLKPRRRGRSRIPVRPSENYLREAMVRTLDHGDWEFDFMVQVQTDPHLMPVEDASVHWPEEVSPYVTVARLRLPAQRFASDEQLRLRRRAALQPLAQPPRAQAARELQPRASADVLGAGPAAPAHELGRARRADRRRGLPRLPSQPLGGPIGQREELSWFRLVLAA